MRRYSRDLVIIVLLFLLPLIVFWQQTVGGKTLLPAENLYQYQPYAAYREQLGVPGVPHNALLSDLVLENLQWKSFIRQNLAQGEIPLWNPHQFSGIPFFAAGQQSTLYPFSLMYYVLPLPAAYGWFTVAQLWLAGVFMYAFARGLNVGRAGGAVAGVTYQLSAFFVISAVFPMIIAAAVWLPLLLLMVENIIRQRPLLRGKPSSVPWVAVGAVALGCNILAGHVEITYYTLIIMAYYAAARLLWQWWTERRTEPPGHEDVGTRYIVSDEQRARRALPMLIRRGGWLVVMVALGLALGAVQFIPLFEFASINFRSGSASFDQVLGWAHPPRDIIQFALPNFYGSPAHHGYFDLFGGQSVSLIDTVVSNASGGRVTHTDWGIKNYVEGALYVGILPLALALFGLIVHPSPPPLLSHASGERRSQTLLPVHMGGGSNQRFGGEGFTSIIFAVLALLSLTFMFGLPTYALLYLLPGIDQLHSPFRWVFGLTLSVAVLAGFGMDALVNAAADRTRYIVSLRWARRFGWALVALGVLVLAGLLLSRLLYPQLEPIIQRLLDSMVTSSGAPASSVFVSPQMFYSYQFPNVLVLCLMLLGSGAVFLWGAKTSSPPTPLTRKRGEGVAVFALALIAADLMIASWGFNPASDPAWLDFTPPAITWLQEQPGEWRYTTLVDPTQANPDIFNANLTLRYGLDDIRGYESIIPKQYVDFMQTLAPQTQLDFNRVAPLYTIYPDGISFDYREALTSPLLDALNVRYVITHTATSLDDVPGYALAYEDAAVRIWENADYLPRAYIVPDSAISLTRASSREMLLDLPAGAAGQPVVVSETFLPGWRAFIRPQGTDESRESPLTMALAQSNFMGVTLPDSLPESETGGYTVRLVYSPQSFQIGLFASFISGIVLALLLGGWLWRLFVAAPTEAADNRVGRIARNSLAPILLNLFNRGIDFAFAFVMLRVLGPEGAGNYYYAGVIFVWFDIFTNFGLYVYLTREVSRDRSKARLLFLNTSLMRIGLALLGVPLLLGFLGARQAVVTPPLNAETILAIFLLYVGLLPNNISTGMTSIYYAFERAEIPAAVATIATICKAVFGLVALLLGWGIVGLAAVSILTNFITLGILWWNGRDMLHEGRDATVGARHAAPLPVRADRGLMRRMMGESWSLMLNHFLATIFIQIDIVVIEAFHGASMVGIYSVAYKWLMALNIIPSFFTQALLPIMARQAHEDQEGLKRNYVLSLKLLLSVALPTAVFFTFMATPLVALLGGAEYLPDSAIATQLIIWSIPIGWMNSLTQYVFIALDLQRKITRAFFIGVTFNIVTNLLFVPRFGYQAAAITTIASEAVLLIPFSILLNNALGRIDWLDLLWRPVAATAAMFAVLALGWNIQPLLALVVGIVVYVGVWLALRTLTPEEWARLMPLIPARLRRALPQRA